MLNSLTDAEFDEMKNFIYEKSGIHFSEINRPILESRLKERLRIVNIDTIDAYYKIITTNEEEMKILLDSVTTNLTRFFRNQPQMDAFEKYIIPTLVEYKKKHGQNTIKIWSAGCSTGEEPYTLAMILQEVLPPGFSYQITASDLSLKSLMAAKTGFYSDDRIGGVPEKYLSKYFVKASGGYNVSEKLKQSIKFDYHNLKFDSGLRGLDVVFCRNVIIYFDEAAQENVINKFWEALNNHAYIVIGHSESLFGMKTQFQFLKTEWATFYTKILD